jgi:hypothetical protein
VGPREQANEETFPWLEHQALFRKQVEAGNSFIKLLNGDKKVCVTCAAFWHYDLCRAYMHQDVGQMDVTNTKF